jgi:hypothetical protein
MIELDKKLWEYGPFSRFVTFAGVANARGGNI